MHRFAFGIYKFALRAQGGYTLLLVLISSFGLPIFHPAELFALPLLVTALGLGLGLFLIKQGWQPDFLRNPRGLIKGLGAMLASNAIFVLAVLLGYVAVLNMDLQEPLSRSVAMTTAAPTFFFTGLMWCASLFLISAKPNDRKSATSQAPLPGAKTHPEPALPDLTADDLRNLRISRMG